MHCKNQFSGRYSDTRPAKCGVRGEYLTLTTETKRIRRIKFLLAIMIFQSNSCYTPSHPKEVTMADIELKIKEKRSKWKKLNKISPSIPNSKVSSQMSLESSNSLI